MLRGGRSQRPSHGRDYQPRHSCKREGAGQGHASPGTGASLGFGQWDSGFARPSTNQPWARLRAPASQGGVHVGTDPPRLLSSKTSRGQGKAFWPCACEGAAAHTPRWLASGRQRPGPPQGHLCRQRRANPATPVMPAAAGSRAGGRPGPTLAPYVDWACLGLPSALSPCPGPAADRSVS